jgi:hypothetical protein
MSIRDFVKKHKGKLITASGILASLLAMAALTEKRKRERRAYQGVANLMRGEPDIPIVEHIVRERRHSEPSWPLVPFRHRRAQSAGFGKKNSLLKAVQAYRKKHGCSLKEAWAAVRQ